MSVCSADSHGAEWFGVTVGWTAFSSYVYGKVQKVEALLAIMTLSKFAFSDVTAFPTLPFWSIEYIYTAYWQSASEVPALISVCLPDSLCAYRVRYITSLTACVWYITYGTTHL